MKGIILPILLVLATIARTQNLSSLTVGDRMQDVQMQVYPQQQISFSSIKQRLVILDFWATWCGACVSNFPKLDSMQQDYKEDLKIILINEKVNKDGPAKVKEFYDKWKAGYGHPLRLPTIIDDTELRKIFPHQGIPHYVWIYDGKVIGITSLTEVTRSNIRKILAGEPYFLARKMELATDRPLFLTEYVPLERIPGYSVLVRGDNGMTRGIGDWKKDKDGAVNGVQILNVSLPDMYRLILYGINRDIAIPKRVLMLAKDSASLYYTPSTLYSKAEWEAAHLYSFEFSGFPGKGNAIYYQMIEALNLYTGLTAKIEPVKQNCMVLTMSNADSLRTKGGAVINGLGSTTTPVLQNGPVSWLVNRLNKMERLPLVVDETNFAGNIDLKLDPKDYSNYESIAAALKKYGLKLTELEREVDMLVIREK
jgi:thiol-disulfide isomerase/thioredoxin